MYSTRTLSLIALAILLPLAAFCQGEHRTVPVPSDGLEPTAGSIRVLEAPQDRAEMIELLNRARENYRLRDAGRGYDLKTSFTVNSGGRTKYDGAWTMEEIFAPGLGTRWTATAAAGYTTTRIRANGLSYEAGTADTIPLSLHQAHGALLGAMESVANAGREQIRASTMAFQGARLTCVLLSDSEKAPAPAAERGWNETDECIDPASGLLRVHSLVRGRYAVYDYTNAVDFHGHLLPRRLIITEAGAPVVDLHVDSLEDLSEPDPALFVPTGPMLANGPATEIAGAIKLQAPIESGAVATGSMRQPTIVLGLLTSGGEIVEAHALRPSDPASEAAVESVEALSLPARSSGEMPEQHEVFVLANSH